MSNGIIQGGWEYVWAAYGLVSVGLLTYSLLLLHTKKRLRHDIAQAAQSMRSKEQRAS